MSWLRRLKLKRYKKKKVKSQKTFTDRHYAVKFKIKIEDENHPYTINKNFDMVVPAKAAYFAKRKLRDCIADKIVIEFDDINQITYEEWEQHERDRETCTSKDKE